MDVKDLPGVARYFHWTGNLRMQRGNGNEKGHVLFIICYFRGCEPIEIRFSFDTLREAGTAFLNHND